MNRDMANDIPAYPDAGICTCALDKTRLVHDCDLYPGQQLRVTGEKLAGDPLDQQVTIRELIAIAGKLGDDSETARVYAHYLTAVIGLRPGRWREVLAQITAAGKDA